MAQYSNITGKGNYAGSTSYNREIDRNQKANNIKPNTNVTTRAKSSAGSTHYKNGSTHTKTNNPGPYPYDKGVRKTVNPFSPKPKPKPTVVKPTVKKPVAAPAKKAPAAVAKPASSKPSPQSVAGALKQPVGVYNNSPLSMNGKTYNSYTVSQSGSTKSVSNSGSTGNAGKSNTSGGGSAYGKNSGGIGTNGRPR